ncbi:TPA: hypothetical protein MIH26_02880 [Klebsiella pneumoniae]|uniref:Uncharacterized protein n=2 Tax=Klebsiella pneumoniae TaxID=573 RepID=A0A181Z1A5_KLEPN|nr:hypothetical protein KP13_05024 [Klebsiella pneumoniae subsp. pneumoniae Kp13]APM03083.1 hypothetical protein BTE51_14745 [Klebsiella pneumoniae]AQT17092.1 hypothetical protein B1U44_22240 [Klebsiella pneumoniae subsp. pneumoniae]AVO97349.1 hypothetical protein AM475_22240 [Klebsiella pneumoniae subsp. ozaenae]EGF58774.1 hypothetical protein HMPREF9538_05828 [Klebsiella sp. MS 92-3]EKF79058.1 Hypothetical protein B819_98494 [Klebsiella pneumoniae subsp. pneumoniae KpQ3]ESB01093.1 hypotheti
MHSRGENGCSRIFILRNRIKMEDCAKARDFTECPGAMQWRGMKKNEKAAMRRLFSQPAAIICTNRR